MLKRYRDAVYCYDRRLVRFSRRSADANHNTIIDVPSLHRISRTRHSEKHQWGLVNSNPMGDYCLIRFSQPTTAVRSRLR